MTPLQLKEHLGGEFLANKLRAVVDGKVVILARLENDTWTMTDAGTLLAQKANAETPKVTEKPKDKFTSRKPAKPVLESPLDSD